MRAFRAITQIAWLAILAGCPSPSPSRPAAASRPPAIEASPATERAAGPAPIGEGDSEAQRCFDDAPSGDATSPCRSDRPGACAARCRRGDPGACRTFAEALPPPKLACRTKIRELACERDELAACTDLAEQLAGLDGQGDEDEVVPPHPAPEPSNRTGPRDDERARSLATRACDGGYARGCRVAGSLTSDPSAALERMDRACELGDAEGCVASAKRYNHGIGEDSDRTTAAARLKRACELGHLDACVDLAIAHATAQGVPRDAVRARQILERICSLDGKGDGGRSCFYLVTFSKVLTASQAPPIPTEQLYERACDKGQLDACAWVAQQLYGAGRYGEAIEVATAVLAERPKSWAALYARGMAHFDEGQHREAAADLEALCPLRADWAYCPLWLYAARERAGIPGGPALDRQAKARSNESWPEPVFRFFLGKIGSRQLLHAARDPQLQRQKEKECEAFYYIGQRHLIEGRQRQAIRMFQQTLATGITDFVEYIGARAELTRLGVPPTKP